MKNLLLLLFAFSPLFVCAQQPKEDSVYTNVTREPQFPGGSEALKKYFRDSLRYPEAEKQKHVEAIVFVTFVVEKDGAISNVSLAGSLGGTNAIYTEAIRLVTAMPKWEPGQMHEKNVRVAMMQTVEFKLDSASASTAQLYSDTDQVFQYVEIMPQFPGGETAMKQYINKNTRYPQMERENNIQGTVWVSFIVEKDGSVTNVIVSKGVQRGPGLDKEAVRVVTSMPKWSPGEMNGKRVRCKQMVPVEFRLQ